MIVSASRRTDIPSFHAGWLRERLAAGWADVRHPFAPSRVRRVELTPAPAGPLEALVLWTRDPSPLLPDVEGWENRGLRTLWLVTLTGYPDALEPGGAPEAVAVGALRELAARVGPDRVAWRYDPVVVSASLGLDASWHGANFRRLGEALRGAAGRCVVSYCDGYAAARRRLDAAGIDVAPRGEAAEALRRVSAAAAELGLPLQTCCEDAGAEGIPPGACIDGALLDRLWGTGCGARRDPGQRAGCRCAPSVDIGAYGTCGRGCLYCYAQRRTRGTP